MSRFDFISDEKLRASLDEDYQELQNCMSVKAWKATHVIAGSIIEAILIDHLIVIGYTKIEPLKMTLDQAVRACFEESVISQRTVDFSNVIRSYRNLIHPGRSARLDESVDGESAKVADALVRIVIQDLSRRKSRSYGYTAEQIVKKLESDASAIAILTNLLIELNEREKERLLLNVIQDKYFEILESQYDDLQVMDALRTCFFQTFDLVDEQVRAKLLIKFARIVKEESQYFITTYEDAFFKAKHLKHLVSESDKNIVKKHLFSRLNSEMEISMLEVLEGIAVYITKEDHGGFIDCLVKLYINKKEDRLKTERFIYEQYFKLNEKIQSAILGRVDQWIKFLDDNGKIESVGLVKKLKMGMTLDFSEDLPF